MTDESRDTLDIEQILAEYIDRLNDGHRLDPDRILAEHPGHGPDILEHLESFVESTVEGNGDRPFGTLGDYTLRRQIGRGGMGVVYEAWQNSVERSVALKVLPAGIAADNKAFMRFMREAKTAAQLSHPNVVGVHGMGVEQNTPYYAMEYVEGETLAQILSKLKEADPETDTAFGPKDQGDYFIRLARAFADVADGLQHAHSKGVVHRDIKPSNLILDRDGRLRILDFGLARLEGQESLTLSGDFVGTPLYMSPEQARRKKIPVDHRTDVYSLGATMYEVICGRPPFRGKDHAETLSQIIEREPASLAKSNQRFPKDIETIVLKCLRKDSGDRYGTAEALGQDLRRFVRGDPIEAKRDSALYVLRKTLLRYRTAASIGLAFFALIALALVTVSWLYWRAEELTDEMETQRDMAVAAEQATAAKSVRLALGQLYGAQAAFDRGDLRHFRDVLASCPEEVGGWAQRRLRYLDLLLEEQGRTIATEASGVGAAAFSPDGRSLAWGTGDGRVVHYDIATRGIGWNTTVLDDGTGVRGLAYGPGVVLVGSNTQQVAVLDPQTGRIVRTLGCRERAVRVAISPDGAWGSCANDYPSKTVELLDVRSGDALATLSKPDEYFPKVFAMEFSASGEQLVAACTTTLVVWDLREASGTIEGVRAGDWDAPSDVAWIGDGRELMYTTSGGDVKRLRGSGSETTLIGSQNSNMSEWPQQEVVWAGSNLAASTDCTTQIRIWKLDSEARAAHRTLMAHEYPIRVLESSPEVGLVASADGRGTLKLWNLRFREDRMRNMTWQPVVARTIRGRLSISSDGRRLAWSSGAHHWWSKEWTALFDARRLVPVNVFLAAGGQGVFSPDSNELLVALGNRGQGAGVFDLKSGERSTLPSELKIGYRPHRTQGISWAPDGKTVALADDRRIEVWSRDSDKSWSRVAHTESERGVFELAFTPDGEELIAGCSGGIVLFLEPDTLEERARLESPDLDLRDLEVTPDGRRILATAPWTTLVWDRPERRELEHLRIWSSAEGFCLAIDPQSDFVAIGTPVGVEVWHIETGIKTLVLPAESVHSLVFGQDGTLFGVAALELKVWPVAANEEDVARRIETSRKAALAPGVLSWPVWASEGLARNWPFDETRAEADPLLWATEHSRSPSGLEDSHERERFDAALRSLREPQRWRIAGPFAVGTDVDASLAMVHPIEEAADPLTVEGVNWQTMTVVAADITDRHFRIDEFFEGEAVENAVAYALARVRLEEDLDCTLRLEADDRARVWVNGQPISFPAVTSYTTFGSLRSPITLRAGENTVLLKIANKRRGWGFGVSIVDELGIPVALE